MAIASDLGSEFDFMRIDLYDDSGSIFFGEYTPYVCSGLIGFRPRSFDADLGRKWRLPDLTAAAMPERRTTG